MQSSSDQYIDYMTQEHRQLRRLRTLLELALGMKQADESLIEAALEIIDEELAQF